MTNLEAAAILELLAQGIDPLTGEILGAEHVCCDIRVFKALSMATKSLRGMDSAPAHEPGPKTESWVRKNGKLSAGRPWTREENETLLRLHEQGFTPEEIAPKMDRRPRGVRNQLQALTAHSGAPRAKMHWLPEEDEELARLHPDMTEQALGRHFGRSAYAIHCRLIRLGLIPDERNNRSE